MKSSHRNCRNDMPLRFSHPKCRVLVRFFILPYKLRRSEDGLISIETPEPSFEVAARSAQSLIGLTELEAIKDLLKAKWEPFDYA
jgi:hypothetical protein